MMSKTTTALLFKLIGTFLATWIVFGMILDNPMGHIITLAVLATILNYLLGDLMVLPRYGNVVASIGDGILGALTAYILSLISRAFDTTLATLLLFTVIVAVFEYFFHQYLLSTDKLAPNEG